MPGRKSKHLEWRRGPYRLTSDPRALDVKAAHRLLKTTYWARHRTMKRFRAALASSCFASMFHGRRQIGFARWITDRAVFAWLTDVVIDPEYRGRGLGRLLIKFALAMPEAVHCRKWLSTIDAKELYAGFGFEPMDAMRLTPADDTPDAHWGKPTAPNAKAARRPRQRRRARR